MSSFIYTAVLCSKSKVFICFHRLVFYILLFSQAWLDIDNVKPDMALGYLKPIKLLSWHPVSTAVNNSRNKSTDCNKKIMEEDKSKKKTQKTLQSWFTKAEKRKSTDTSDSDPKKSKLE